MDLPGIHNCKPAYDDLFLHRGPTDGMAPQSFTLLSIMLCAVQVHSLCRLQGALVEKVNGLAENMGGYFPFECLDQNVQLTFPAAAFKSNGTSQVNVGIKKSIYEALRKIDVLFENDTMPNSWDQRKVDDFRNIVYRLVEENECVLNSSQANEDDFPNREILLDAYFKEMADLLQQKKFSACAWEVVRKETLRTLGFILQNASDHLFWTRRHGHKRRR